jgi:predicted N-formylglutamate amidohydrolase
MKTFVNQAAQGDVWFSRVGDVAASGRLLPSHAVRETPEISGTLIVAHSETGHHHVMDAGKVEMYRLPEEIYECFLVVKEETTLDHLRPYDTHESIMFQPGIYRVRRQREYTPEGLRRVAD